MATRVESVRRPGAIPHSPAPTREIQPRPRPAKRLGEQRAGKEGRGGSLPGAAAAPPPAEPSLLGKVSAKLCSAQREPRGRRGPGGRGPAAGGRTFADAHFVLGDGVAIERGADDTAQPPVAGSVEPVGAAAALVPLAGAHVAAAADALHDAPGAAPGLFALGLVAGQADQRLGAGARQQQQQPQQRDQEVPAAGQPPAPRHQVHPPAPPPPPPRSRAGSGAGALPCAGHTRCRRRTRSPRSSPPPSGPPGRASPRGARPPPPLRAAPTPSPLALAPAVASPPPPPPPRREGEKEKSFLPAAAVQPKLLAAAAAALGSSPGWRRLLPLLLRVGRLRGGGAASGPVPASRAAEWARWRSRRSAASAPRAPLASLLRGSSGRLFMARASAARAAPSPILPHPPDLAPPRRAPLIGCPPPPPARPAPSPSSPPSPAAGPFLPRTPPPLPPLPPPPAAGRTAAAPRPSLRASLWLGHRERAAPRRSGDPRRAARVVASRAPAGPAATVAGLGASGARRLHRRASFECGEWRRSPKLGAEGMAAALAGAPAGSNPETGKQRHGTSANWMRIHLPLELGIDFCERYYVMESREARDASSEAAGELIKCFKRSR